MSSEKAKYFVRTKSWAEEGHMARSRQVRLAWVIAGCACAVALFEAVALAVLLPLRTVEPITVLVDRTTGYVQEVDPRGAQRIRADEALTQSLLAQYVVSRESFDRATVKSDYRRTALWSSGAARNSYLASIPKSSPDSPFNRYKPGSVVTVDVKSISQLGPGNAMVRFDTFIAGEDGRKLPLGSWVSVIRFRFSDAPMSYEDRLTNPLGLQVTGYRRDTEKPAATAAGFSTPSVPRVPFPVEQARPTATSSALGEASQ